jgi:penicillin-binding protein 1A
MLRRLSRFAAVIGASGAVMAVAVAAFGVPMGMLAHVGSGRPAPIDFAELEQRSYVYASDGALLATLHGEFNRQPIELANVPPHVVNAILAVEDKGFWTHTGVDGRALMRAFSVNVGEGDVAQGASTITQQLVKLSVLSSEKTLDRKVQEIVLARRLEREMSKEEILTRYLNTVYFGNHAYGIEAAAETYFGVPTEQLDKAQAALLAGLIRNPSSYNPVRFPDRATERRKVALERMEEEGVVTADEVTYINAVPVPTEVHEFLPQPDDYFVEEVKQQLLDDPRLGATREEREKAVFTGGLKVYTTFDPRAQELALQARDNRFGEGGLFDTGVPAIDPNTGEQIVDPNTGEVTTVKATASIVSVDPASGGIRAMVGGPGFDTYQYNLATQTPPRQIGSSFKTFVLATLMEEGYSPYDTVNGTAPCTFVKPVRDSQGPTYTVSSHGGGYGTLLQQTIDSVNCAYLRLGNIAGLQNVIDLMGRLGIRNPRYSPNIISLPLGVEGATVVEMAGAYAAFVNDGVFNPPYYIDRVEDAHGRVIWEHEAAPTQALSAQAARLVTKVLAENVNSGTATAAQLPDNRSAAGKTGTTDQSADGWFVGSTPQLTTAVWVGGLGAEVPLTFEGRPLYGGGPPAQIWGQYMAAWHEGMEVLPFAEAEDPLPASRLLKASANFDPEGQGDPAPPPEEPPGGGGGGGGGPGGPGGTVPFPTFPTPIQQPTTTTTRTQPTISVPTIPDTRGNGGGGP